MKPNNSAMSRIKCHIEVDPKKGNSFVCESLDSIISVADLFSVIASILAAITFAITYRGFFVKTRDLFTYLDKDDLKATAIIERELEELRLMVSADRVAIGTFSNGEYYGKKKIQTMTCRFEARPESIASLKQRINAVDVGKFSKDLDAASAGTFTAITARSLGKQSFLEKVNTKLSKRTSKPQNVSPGCLKYMDYIGVDVICSRMMNDGKGDLGILHIHYVNEPDDISLVNRAPVEAKFNRINYMLEVLVKQGAKTLIERSPK